MKKLIALFVPVLILTACSETTNPPEDLSTSSPTENIIVDLPAPGDTVSSPITIVGQARVFENQFSWQVIDGNGTVIAEGNGTANSPDIGEYGDFEVTADGNGDNVGRNGRLHRSANDQIASIGLMFGL